MGSTVDVGRWKTEQERSSKLKQREKTEENEQSLREMWDTI